MDLCAPDPVMKDREGSFGFKLFQDSVHGVMKFHPVLVKFIDTVVFQRLRNVKQLSTTYWVFPAAAHNRFEHSLGVAFLAGELMKELKENSPSVWDKIFPSPEEGEKISLAVQIAGLLHDLGHGPFSHTWEVFVAASGGAWDHESTSCFLIDKMLGEKNELGKFSSLTKLGELFKETFGEVEKYVDFIKDVIQGVPPEEIKEPAKAFLYQIVANKFNDVDVDKFDYFLRDAQHLKMNVSFDYERLIKMSSIVIENGISYVAFRDVERFSIQGMFRVRADLHIRAYQHRVAKNLEIMLIDALKEADRSGYKVSELPLSRIHENPDEFVKLTDSILESLLYSSDNRLQPSRDLLTRLVTRDLYETVAEWRLKVSQSEEEKKANKISKGLTRKDLNKLEDVLENKFALTQIKIDQGKYMDPLKNVCFFEKHGKDVVKRNVPEMKMGLPFYKLVVFKRGRENHDLGKIKQKTDEFLKELDRCIVIIDES